MPITKINPGVYIDELPNAVRTITGVSTSITAFIGSAEQGPTDYPILIHNFEDFSRIFGGLWKKSNMSYAIYQYFQNGGKVAIIVRVHNSATETTFDIGAALEIRAAYPGQWSTNLEMVIEHEEEQDIHDIVETEKAIDPSGINTLFNLTVRRRINANQIEDLETFRNISNKQNSPSFVTRVLEGQSDLVRVKNISRPNEQPPESSPNAPFTLKDAGTDGQTLTSEQIIGKVEMVGTKVKKTGLQALDNVDIFNLLCIPPYDATNKTSTDVYNTALSYFEEKQWRAILIIDPPPEWNSADNPRDRAKGIDSQEFGSLRNKNAAIYFSRILALDLLDDNKPREFVPCGVVAGVIARIDSERGVWKAPAGINASIKGISNLTVRLTDREIGELNSLSINCMRIMPPLGIVIWGARTMRGADHLADQWKYLAVRRLALYIEESLYRGTQWIVFEPNDEPLWGKIRVSVGGFMQSLFRQGAFQGPTPIEAYLVKCDEETTTQDDINRGIVNIIVGFAPLKPAEFVVLKIQQLAGRERR